MKKTILKILVLFLAYTSYAQNVNIPDTNFKNALIEAGIDTSGDGEISQDEAEAVTNLDVSNKDIMDMTGIEAFVNLSTLECHFNQLTNLDVSYNIALTSLGVCCNELTSLDISNNTALTDLNCNTNQLTSLDVSNNPNLIYLSCQINMLTSLDISNNTNLIELTAFENQLTSLDISKNTALTFLECVDNLLTSLDVTNNTALVCLLCWKNQLTSLNVSNCKNLDGLQCGDNLLTSLDISNNHDLGLIGYCPRNSGLGVNDMPSLYEVCVWEGFSDSIVYSDGSPNAYFTTGCSITPISAYKENSLIHIYPNPVLDLLTFDFSETASKKTSIILFDITGKVMYSEILDNTALTEHTIDLSIFKEGPYLINISNDEYSITEKVIKVE